QCGGEGNIEDFHRVAREVGERDPYRPYLAGWEGPWNFASAETTAKRLTRAGFEDVRTWLEPSPVIPPEPATYMRVVCLGHHLETLPSELRDRYVDDVMKACGEPVELGYVRLNIQARRGPDV
ncbi:MAG: class I SAM-dependent methyltransferase, partial [Thermoleophilaceae bacterium]